MHFDKTTSAYTSSLIQVAHGFGTKRTGDGRDSSVIKKLLAVSGATYSTIALPGQTHSTNIAVLEHQKSYGDILRIPNVDAVITNGKGIVLTVVTADCVPIIYCDPIAQIIAISHNGWKGTLNRLSSKVINSMVALGADVKKISVAIGPCISGSCYVVEKGRANAFQGEFGEEAIVHTPDSNCIDLPKSNYLDLMAAGIVGQNIDQSRSCTHCDSENYFSYRRDGKIFGEMISYIALR